MLKRLKIDAWPSEQDSKVGSKGHRRKPKSIADFHKKRAEIDELLVAGDTEPLLDVECIAARLYTGPMFRKLNVVSKLLSGK